MATKYKIADIWSDLHHDIKRDAQGGLKKVVNVEAVMTSIDNILGTRAGERVMLPDFASNFGNMVFEPMNQTLMNFVAREIKDVIEKWDNRPEVINVNYFHNPDENKMQVDVAFRIRGYQQVFNFSKIL